MGQVRPVCEPVALRQYFTISIHRVRFPTSLYRIYCYSLPDDSAHAQLSTSLRSFCAPVICQPVKHHCPAAVDYLRLNLLLFFYLCTVPPFLFATPNASVCLYSLRTPCEVTWASFHPTYLGSTNTMKKPASLQVQ